MSTILKSLKRLEKDKEGGQNGNDRPLLTPLGVPRQEMQRAVKLTWLRTRLFRWGVVAVVAIGAVAGLYAYTRPATEHYKIDSQAAKAVRPAPSQPRKAPIPATAKSIPHSAANRSTPGGQQFEPPMPPEGAPHPLEARKFSPPQLPEDGAGTDQPVRPPMPFPQSGPHSAPMQMPARPNDLAKLREYVLSQPTDVETAPDAPGPAAIPNLPPGLAGKRHQPVTRSSDQESLTAAAEAKNSQPSQSAGEEESTIYANAERMTDGRLKVQAIVWSETPEDRMAVVNNRTVREGGTIDGFSVVGIGEDAIFVREDGTRLIKVLFGGP